MKKLHILTKPIAVKELQNLDLDDRYTSSWRFKAERLQARRWRKFKQQMA